MSATAINPPFLFIYAKSALKQALQYTKLPYVIVFKSLAYITLTLVKYTGDPFSSVLKVNAACVHGKYETRARSLTSCINPGKSNHRNNMFHSISLKVVLSIEYFRTAMQSIPRPRAKSLLASQNWYKHYSGPTTPRLSPVWPLYVMKIRWRGTSIALWHICGSRIGASPTAYLKQVQTGL